MDCIICKRKLKGFHQKFCGDFCATYYKKERARILRQKRRKKYPPKFCAICKSTFIPIRIHHYVCSKNCRSKFNKDKRRQVQQARKPQRIIKPMECFRSEIPSNLETHQLPIFNENCSANKNEILEFIKNGGEITKFPSTPSAKTPSVNRAYAWIPDELFGSALLYEMGDEDDNR